MVRSTISRPLPSFSLSPSILVQRIFHYALSSMHARSTLVYSHCSDRRRHSSFELKCSYSYEDCTSHLERIATFIFLHRACVCRTCCSFTFTEKLWLQQEDALQLSCCGVPTHTHVRTQPAGSQGKATNQTGFLPPFLSSAVFCSQWAKGRGEGRGLPIITTLPPLPSLLHV